jgi:hypothetical protein
LGSRPGALTDVGLVDGYEIVDPAVQVARVAEQAPDFVEAFVNVIDKGGNALDGADVGQGLVSFG